LPYEPQFDRFETVASNGERRSVTFLRAGFLTTGDQPELYFFRVGGEKQEVVVGISGGSLRRFEQGRKSLSREAKIDLAGLLLKRRIEAGAALDSRNLFLRDEELEQVASELGLPVRGLS
jgi:hypothetical protein